MLGIIFFIIKCALWHSPESNYTTSTNWRMTSVLIKSHLHSTQEQAPSYHYYCVCPCSVISLDKHLYPEQNATVLLCFILFVKKNKHFNNL